MTDDEWQTHVTHEAAKAIGEWLEGRGRLHQPIRCLTMPELESMAQNAISRWIVLASRGSRTPRRVRSQSSRCCWVKSLAGCSRANRAFYYTITCTRPISDLRILLVPLPTRGRGHRQKEDGMIDKTDMEHPRDQGCTGDPRRGADRWV